MYRLKTLLTALLVVFVLVDIVGGYHLWDSGWPKRVSVTSDQTGVALVHVVPIPFTGIDWLILAFAVGFHAVLFCLVWKAWHASPVRK